MEAAVVISPHTGQQWLWTRNGERVMSGTLDNLAAWYAEQEGRGSLILLLPGEDVLLATTGMPTRNPTRISRALPFALEEHVLDDPASLHCVAGPWVNDETISCAAIDRGRLDGLLDDLAGRDLVPDKACPDSLCVPWKDGEIHVVAGPARILVRWDACSAAAGEAGFEDILIHGIRAVKGREAARTVRHDADNDQALFGLLAARAGRSPIDLLQGDFLPLSRQAGWPTWKLPAALAVAALLLLLGTQGVQTWQLSRESAHLAAAIEQQFGAAFPHINRIQSDPAPQVALELRRLRQRPGSSESTFLELLTRTAPVIGSSPGIKLQRLHYRNGDLELGLTAGRIADLDALSLRLRATGITASQGAAQLDNDRVNGTITVAVGSGS